ncbi:MAG: vWA domain-containing protein [Myxococcota bacterium]
MSDAMKATGARHRIVIITAACLMIGSQVSGCVAIGFAVEAAIAARRDSKRRSDQRVKAGQYRTSSETQADRLENYPWAERELRKEGAVGRTARAPVLPTKKYTPNNPPPADMESHPTLVYIAPFHAEDSVVELEELHLIAAELFKNELAGSRKFNFAGSSDAKGVQLVINGKVGRSSEGLYRLELGISSPGEDERSSHATSRSLEDLVQRSASAVGRLRKTTGYVIKRIGDKIVIARGSQHGIKVGQKYKTTDTHESFVITRVGLQTAEGRIVGQGAVGAPSVLRGATITGELGAVDVVFVLDTTGSMQEEIDGVLANCERFADRLAARGIDARLGLVTFRVGVRQVHSLTADIQEFKGWLGLLKAARGGIETPFAAMQTALSFDFRDGAVPLFILITDEAPYDALAEHGLVVENGAWTYKGGRTDPPSAREVFRSGIAPRVLADVQRKGGAVFSVTLDDFSGVYRYLAQRSGGAFYDLSTSQDFSALLDTIGRQIEGMFEEM